MSASLVPFFMEESTKSHDQEFSNGQWTNVTHLLQTKTADTAHTEIFASVTRLFLILWAEPRMS